MAKRGRPRKDVPGSDRTERRRRAEAARNAANAANNGGGSANNGGGSANNVPFPGGDGDDRRRRAQPEPPSWYSARVKAVWRGLVAEVELYILTDPDLADETSELGELYADYAEARRAMRESPTLIEKDGETRPHPAIRAVEGLFSRFDRSRKRIVDREAEVVVTVSGNTVAPAAAKSMHETIMAGLDGSLLPENNLSEDRNGNPWSPMEAWEVYREGVANYPEGYREFMASVEQDEAYGWVANSVRLRLYNWEKYGI